METFARFEAMDRALKRQLEGFGLTTAHIFYHFPDQPSLLQQYIWQEYDLAPHFPELKHFLDFWSASLDGALHSVRVAHQRLIQPSEYRAVNGVLTVH